MKVRELRAVLAEADDDADVIVTRHSTAGGVVMTFKPGDVFEATEAKVQPSGKVSIQYDESKKADYE
jgi:hypothetical protein